MYIDDRTRVMHMIQAAEEAIAFASGHTQEDLKDDRALALLLTKCLEMAGEAAFKVSRDYRDAHLEIPWKSLIDLRNHLVHEYHDIDTDRVWTTIELDIPSIVPALRALLAGFQTDTSG